MREKRRKVNLWESWTWQAEMISSNLFVQERHWKGPASQRRHSPPQSPPVPDHLPQRKLQSDGHQNRVESHTGKRNKEQKNRGETEGERAMAAHQNECTPLGQSNEIKRWRQQSS